MIVIFDLVMEIFRHTSENNKSLHRTDVSTVLNPQPPSIGNINKVSKTYVLIRWVHINQHFRTISKSGGTSPLIPKNNSKDFWAATFLYSWLIYLDMLLALNL